jgi:protein ImuA
VICTIAPSAKALSLTATRRLLLAAEKHATRCVLLRLDNAGASAAWMRWRIAAAPSRGEARELGPPAFTALLERNRAGPSGQSWRIEWNAHDRTFNAAEAALDGAVADAPVDRPVEARRRRAI